jgi:hypothetical protein
MLDPSRSGTCARQRLRSVADAPRAARHPGRPRHHRAGPPVRGREDPARAAASEGDDPWFVRGALLLSVLQVAVTLSVLTGVLGR